MIKFMPRWSSYIAITTKPIFTPKQCDMVVKVGCEQRLAKAQIGTNPLSSKIDNEKRISTTSWIPFNEMPEMYQDINNVMQITNSNHFGFENMKSNEEAQYTEYEKDAFYDWHMDLEINGADDSPIRKISMTILLSDPSTFEGGDLQFIEKNNLPNLQQGQAVFFASFIRHRVTPVTKGIRRSLVMWFGGQPFK